MLGPAGSPRRCASGVRPFSLSNYTPHSNIVGLGSNLRCARLETAMLPPKAGWAADLIRHLLCRLAFRIVHTKAAKFSHRLNFAASAID